MSTNEFDAVAVQQDAASVHALATRAFGEVDMNDPAVALLAAWVAEIDNGVDEVAQFVMPQNGSSGSSPVAISAPRGRRAALIAGSAAFALVVSGGAAAAVTGDPLAAVRAPLHALEKLNPFADTVTNARERLPLSAPTTANANKLLADAQRAMARGQTSKAQKLIAEAEALLGGTANPGQLNRLEKLKAKVAGQSDPKGKGPVNTLGEGQSDPKGKGPVNTPGKGQSDPKGKGSVSTPGKGTSDPKGKGPVDKAGSQQSGGSLGGGSTGGSTQPPNDETSSQGLGPGSDKSRDTGGAKESVPGSTHSVKASESKAGG
jgi:hypothetical protein